MAVKKTTAKPATKTTAKPASKAAKPATKTTAKGAAKPAAKTAPKTTAMSAGLNVTGNKKIETLRKEFNKIFPYLRLGIFYSYAREQVKKGEPITPIDGSKTLASVRRADSGGEISIAPNKRVESVEKEFDKAFGLYCQICYTDGDGRRYYTSGSDDKLTLAALNKKLEAEGAKKNEWK